MPQIDIRGQAAPSGGGTGSGGGGPGSGPGGPSGPANFQRMKFSAEEAARMEFRLRKALNDYERREEKKLFEEKLRLEKRDFQEQRREEARVKAESRKAEREQARAERVEQQRRRSADARFERGALVGGAIGVALSQGNLQSAVRVVGGAAGGAIGELAGGTKGGIVGALIGELIATSLNPSGPIAKAAKDAIDLQLSTYAMGRAGGFSGAGLYDAFGAGSNQAPGWERVLGMSAAQAMTSLGSLGVVPHGNPLPLARMIGANALSPAFAGMAGGSVEGLLGQGLGYGMAGANAGSAATFMQPFARVLEEASARGFDRSKLLASMEGSIDQLAKSGALGVSSTGVSDLVWRLASTGIAGGRTGALAAQTIAGVSSTLENVTQNPLTSTLLFSQMGKFGGLKTPGDVQKFVGPAAWTALNSGGNAAQTARMVTMINQAAADGNMPMALTYASQLARSDPNRLQQLLGPAMGAATGGRGYLQAPILANAMGVPLSTAAALATAPAGSAPAGTSDNYVNSVLGLAGGGGPENFLKTFFPGVRITGGARDQTRNKEVRGAKNSMHLTGQALDFALPKGTTFQQFQAFMRKNGVPATELLNEPAIGNQGPHVHWGWRQKNGGSGNLAETLSRPTGDRLGLPQAGMALQANAAQGDLFTANQALTKLGPAALSATDGLNKLAGALSRIVKQMNGPHTAPWGMTPSVGGGAWGMP